MRLVTFMTAGPQIRKILDHIGVDSVSPFIVSARRPPLLQDGDAQVDQGALPDWDLAAQPAPVQILQPAILFRSLYTGFPRSLP